jgi:hypothetical protein
MSRKWGFWRSYAVSAGFAGWLVAMPHPRGLPHAASGDFWRQTGAATHGEGYFVAGAVAGARAVRGPEAG